MYHEILVQTCNCRDKIPQHIHDLISYCAVLVCVIIIFLSQLMQRAAIFPIVAAEAKLGRSIITCYAIYDYSVTIIA